MNLGTTDFYKNFLAQFGSSAKSVGWKNEEAQRIRFDQLSKLFPDKGHISISDLGCGVGDFVSFLNQQSRSFTYFGYDLMADMILKATEKYGTQNNVQFREIKSPLDMEVSDYTVASGIFNLRFESTDEDWIKHIVDTIVQMNARSLHGFAFNVLSKYSDKEFQKKELYYADPLYLFDYCKRHLSKNVALLHDYDQYDFTIIVRK